MRPTPPGRGGGTGQSGSAQSLITLFGDLAKQADGLGAVAQAFEGLAKKAQEATAALGQAGAKFTEFIGKMASGFGLAGNAMMQLASAANPGPAIQLQMALRSLSLTVGQILSPVLQGATEFLRGLATTIYNLSPAAKGVIVGLAAMATAFGVLTVAVTAFSAVMNSALGGAPAVLAAVVAAALGATTAMGGFSGAGEKLAAILKPLKAVWDGFLDALDAGLGAALPGVQSAINTVADALRKLLTDFAPVGTELQKTAVAIGSLVGELARLAGTIVGTLVDVAKPGVQSLAEAIQALVRDLNRLVVTFTVVARHAADLDFAKAFDFAGLAAEIDAEMRKLDEAVVKRDRSKAPPQRPLDVKTTSAEAFAGEMRRRAYLALGGGEKPADPMLAAAQKAEGQRERMITGLGEIANRIAKLAVDKVVEHGPTMERAAGGFSEGFFQSFVGGAEGWKALKTVIDTILHGGRAPVPSMAPTAGAGMLAAIRAAEPRNAAAAPAGADQAAQALKELRDAVKGWTVAAGPLLDFFRRNK